MQSLPFRCQARGSDKSCSLDLNPKFSFLGAANGNGAEELAKACQGSEIKSVALDPDAICRKLSADHHNYGYKYDCKPYPLYDAASPSATTTTHASAPTPSATSMLLLLHLQSPGPHQSECPMNSTVASPSSHGPATTVYIGLLTPIAIPFLQATHTMALLPLLLLTSSFCTSTAHCYLDPCCLLPKEVMESTSANILPTNNDHVPCESLKTRHMQPTAWKTNLSRPAS